MPTKSRASSPVVIRKRSKRSCGASFGPAILNRNGTLNRRALAAVVFANPDARHDLEAILHPAVYRAIQAWFEHLEVLGRHRIGLADIPLLYETERHAGFDKVIVTWCSEELQIQRMLDRGMTEQEAQQRMAAQLPSAEKKARADYVIDTNGTKEETDRQIDAIFDKLVEIVQPAEPIARPSPTGRASREEDAAPPPEPKPAARPIGYSDMTDPSQADAASSEDDSSNDDSSSN
jgi:dephospho-CoA kinase